MGIFDMQQNPFIQSQNTVNLGNIHTGTIFDPLVQLGAQLNAQNNDALIQQQAQKQAELKRQQQLQDMQTKQDNAVALKQLEISNKDKLANAKADKELKRKNALARTLGLQLGSEQLDSLSASDIRSLKKETSKPHTFMRDLATPDGKLQTTIIQIDGNGNIVKQKPIGAARVPKSIGAEVGAGIIGAQKAESDKTRIRSLKKSLDANTNIIDLSSRLKGLLTDNNGNPIEGIIGASGKISQLISGGGVQLSALRKSFLSAAANDSIKKGSSFTPSRWFNKNIGEAELLTNMLAYAQAKANDPSGRLSDADVRAAKESLGSDSLLANPKDVLNRIDTLVEIANARNARINEQLTGKPQQSFDGTNAISNPVTANIKGKGAVTFPNQAAFDKFKKAFPDLVQ